MDKAICSSEACDRPVRARGLCERHYQQRRNERLKAGLPTDERGVVPRAPVARVRGRQGIRSGHVLSDVDLDGRTAVCEVCGPGARIRVRQHTDGSPRPVCRVGDRGRRSKRRGGRAWAKYGITKEEVAIRAESQQNRCLICGISFEGRFVVDHDHATGMVRGLLCHHCNVGIGFFRDNPAVMRKAARYVARYSA